MSSIKAEMFYIKNNKSLIIILLGVIYFITLPLCLSIHINSANPNKLIAIYTLMQKILIIPNIVLHSHLYNVYVDREFKEVVLSLDRGFKYKYCIFNYIFIHILHIPFYSNLMLIDKEMIYYIGLYSLQILVLYTMYYMFTKIVYSSFACLSLLLAYVMVFTLLLCDVSFGNIFLINIGFEEVTNNYYIYLMLLCSLCLVVGYLIERTINGKKDNYEKRK